MIFKHQIPLPWFFNEAVVAEDNVHKRFDVHVIWKKKLLGGQKIKMTGSHFTGSSLILDLIIDPLYPNS